MKEKLKDLLPVEWLDKFIETETDCLKLTFSSEGELTLRTSKIGGIGYLPSAMAYPTNLDSGVPLFLLAQLNFSELPQLPDYPEKGILAFYVDYTDDLIGLDIGSPTNQAGFRVLFFEDTASESYTREEQLNFQAGISDELYKVVDDEYKLTGTKEVHYVCGDNYEFKKHFGKTMFEWLNDISDDDETRSKIFNGLSVLAAGSKVGGYPYFTQEDPRLYVKNTAYDTLLFQLDSEKIDNNWGVMWGDMGIGNFFINHEALKEQDFTNINYNWDCG